MRDFPSRIWVLCCAFWREQQTAVSRPTKAALCVCLPCRPGSAASVANALSSSAATMTSSLGAGNAKEDQCLTGSRSHLPHKGQAERENVLLLLLFDKVLGNSWVSRDAIQLVLWPYKVVTLWGCLSRKCVPLCPRDNSGELRLWQQRNPLLVIFLKVSLSLNRLSSLIKKVGKGVIRGWGVELANSPHPCLEEIFCLSYIMFFFHSDFFLIFFLERFCIVSGDTKAHCCVFIMQ